MAKKVQRPIEFITPPNVLRAKLATDGLGLRDPLAAADKALKQISTECNAWAQEEIDKLQEKREAFVAAPKDTKALNALTKVVMDVKGLATQGGYPDADPFATSLIALLTAPGNAASANVPLVEAHIDAIRATRDKKHSTEVAAALAAELSAQTSDLAVGIS
ncbi:MAG: hypothetical protein ACFB0Z_07845 [Candidatus Phaeomarinobacter sp.]